MANTRKKQMFVISITSLSRKYEKLELIEKSNKKMMAYFKKSFENAVFPDKIIDFNALDFRKIKIPDTNEFTIEYDSDKIRSDFYLDLLKTFLVLRRKVRTNDFIFLYIKSTNYEKKGVTLNYSKTLTWKEIDFFMKLLPAGVFVNVIFDAPKEYSKLIYDEAINHLSLRKESNKLKSNEMDSFLNKKMVMSKLKSNKKEKYKKIIEKANELEVVVNRGLFCDKKMINDYAFEKIYNNESSENYLIMTDSENFYGLG